LKEEVDTMVRIPGRVVLKPAYEAIEALGFPVSRESCDGVRGSGRIRGVLSLDPDYRVRGRMNVLCHANVYHSGVDELYRRITGTAGPEGIYVLGSNLRFLIPAKEDYGYWDVGAVYNIPRNECPPDFVDQLRADVAGWGIPFLDRFSSDEDILRCMVEEPKFTGYRSYSLPLLLFLMGRPEEASREVESTQRREAKVHPDAPVRVHRQRMLSLFNGDVGERGDWGGSDRPPGIGGNFS